jgi:hypothetical protein
VNEGEPRLVANRVVAPDFGDVHLVLGREAPSNVDRAGRHVKVKGSASSSEMRPLRHGFEVVDGFCRLDLDRSREASCPICRRQYDVGEYLDLADLDWSRLLLSDVGLNLMPALQSRLQEPDDSVVLELLADRPHQDRAHLTSLLGTNGALNLK